MRDPQQRKSRQCVFPEISRHYNIGERGTHSTGSMYEKYFRYIVKQESAAMVDLGDVRRLQFDRYRSDIERRVKEARQITSLSDLSIDSPTGQDDVVFFSLPSEMVCIYISSN